MTSLDTTVSGFSDTALALFCSHSHMLNEAAAFAVAEECASRTAVAARRLQRRQTVSLGSTVVGADNEAAGWESSEGGAT